MSAGNQGNDDISGMDGNDILLGGEQDDLIQGDWGSDFLSGGDGNDTIRSFSNSGNDTIEGGPGSDHIEEHAGGGPSDADLYLFDHGSGVDFIQDFRPGDIFEIARDINGTGVGDDADILGRTSPLLGTPYTVIDLGAGDQIFVLSPQFAFTGANFRFSNDHGTGDFFG